MRSNFIKVLQSCTVGDFSTSFHKRSLRILTRYASGSRPTVCTGPGGVDVCVGVGGGASRGTDRGFWLLQLCNTQMQYVSYYLKVLHQERLGVCHQTEVSLGGSYPSRVLSTHPIMTFTRKEKCKVCNLEEIQPGAAVVNVNHNIPLPPTVGK